MRDELRPWYTADGRFAAWRMVYAPTDPDTAPRQARHARRAPGLRHLPLPKAGCPVDAKDGSIATRVAARTKANANAVINPEAV